MPHKTRKSQIGQDIDDNLRRVYQQIVEQDVPVRFTQLLDQLRQQEQEQGPQ